VAFLCEALNLLCVDTAYCRSPVTTKWYKYDDHEVTEISSSNIKVWSHLFICAEFYNLCW